MPTCKLPCLSARYSTLPPLKSPSANAHVQVALLIGAVFDLAALEVPSCQCPRASC